MRPGHVYAASDDERPDLVHVGWTDSKTFDEVEEELGRGKVFVRFHAASANPRALAEALERLLESRSAGDGWYGMESGKLFPLFAYINSLEEDHRLFRQSICDSIRKLVGHLDGLDPRNLEPPVGEDGGEDNQWHVREVAG